MKYLLCLSLLVLAGCATQRELLDENRFQKELITKKNAQITDLKQHIHTTEAENNMLREENNALWRSVKSVPFSLSPKE